MTDHTHFQWFEHDGVPYYNACKEVKPYWFETVFIEHGFTGFRETFAEFMSRTGLTIKGIGDLAHAETLLGIDRVRAEEAKP